MEERKPYAKQWLERLRSKMRCDWCGSEEDRNRRGLCRYCERVRKELEKCRYLFNEAPTVVLEANLEIMEAQKTLCNGQGRELKEILDYGVDGEALEDYLCDLSRRIIKDGDLYHGTAPSLDQAFTPAQRQLLAFFVWRIFSVDARKNRRDRARSYIRRSKRTQEEE